MNTQQNNNISTHKSISKSRLKIDFVKLLSQINLCLIKDRFKLRSQLKNIQRDSDKLSQDKQLKLLESWQQRSLQSMELANLRKSRLPEITYNEALPVSQSIKKIQKAFVQNQVIIVASETGSGKTTQLPKMCLQTGRGIFGKIAHTQPRRIAAISVANRIAFELNSELGDFVGYKVRFQDKTSHQSYLKLMTDGMLLAEIQQDHFLNEYDTVIIDEAHERSLNIDFLLGYLKKLILKRRDLKVIITSATINTERFSNFFNQAPVIEVSGKLWPVEVRYRPVELEEQDETDAILEHEVDINLRIVHAVDELVREGGGDILIFFSGEKEIRDALDYLKSQFKDQMIYIPLYARLTAAEQKQIFKEEQKRRIILSTNIAETSLTVPGIEYVIDTGTARISRYSVKNKIQLLPIEKVSQASAKQRSGRCGRVSSGIAIRLYSEDDFQSRSLFTDAEILRTNLAQVILQMLKLRLGNMKDFDFIDKPQDKNINDGYSLLLQLGAIKKIHQKQQALKQQKESYQLTPLGHQISQLNIDPKLAAILMNSAQQGVLNEVLIIISALSCQDPREVPKEKQQQAREKHLSYVDKRSDFISLLNIWRDFQQQKKALSQNKLRKYCYAQFLSFNRLREWQDIVIQLSKQIKVMKITHELALPDEEIEAGQYQLIHQSLLTGLFQFVAKKEEKKIYQACRNLNLQIHPGSGLAKKQPKWILASEIVETSQVFARKVATIEPLWIEQQVSQLMKQQYYEPHWDKKSGKVLAKAKLMLFGLVINPDKKIIFNEIDPQLSHEIFIKEALLTGEYTNFRGEKPYFLKKNLLTIKEVEKLEHKSRRHDILVDDETIVHFYQSRLDSKISTRSGLENWLKKISKTQPELLIMTKEDIMHNEAEHVTEVLYPGSICISGIDIQLEYHFLPGHPLDGVTAKVPLGLLNKFSSRDFTYLVPGMIREKVELILRALPKPVRKELLPINERITEFLQSPMCQNQQYSLNQALIIFIEDKIRGAFKAREAFHADLIDNLTIPYHLLMNFRLYEEKKKNQVNEIDSSRDFDDLQLKWGEQAEQALLALQNSSDENDLEQKGVTRWEVEQIPEHVEVNKWGSTMLLFPAFVDDGNSVSIQLFDTRVKANEAMQSGLFRLYYLACFDEINKLLQSSKYKKDQNKINLLSLFLGKSHQLPSQITAFLVNHLFEPDNLIYKRDDFFCILNRGKENLIEELESLLKIMELTLTRLQSIKKIIKQKTSLPLLNVVKDIDSHLDRLFTIDYLSKVPKKWLQRYPKYIQVIEKRLEKAILDPRKDNLLQLEINQLEKRYLDFIADENWNLNCFEAKSLLLEYRWLLEELRLSLFAQELKTNQPVSIKRLDKLWLEIQDKCIRNIS
ncbi:MAG: ATP-dependent RNA helicase HrpA [Gammaproteobacteria bacterium]|nr:ATP-dependent RNA helicase HrpA [Gammaproteobacteria bacterium]